MSGHIKPRRCNECGHEQRCDYRTCPKCKQGKMWVISRCWWRDCGTWLFKAELDRHIDDHLRTAVDELEEQ